MISQSSSSDTTWPPKQPRGHLISARQLLPSSRRGDDPDSKQGTTQRGIWNLTHRPRSIPGPETCLYLFQLLRYLPLRICSRILLIPFFLFPLGSSFLYSA